MSDTQTQEPTRIESSRTSTNEKNEKIESVIPTDIKPIPKKTYNIQNIKAGIYLRCKCNCIVFVSPKETLIPYTNFSPETSGFLLCSNCPRMILYNTGEYLEIINYN